MDLPRWFSSAQGELSRSLEAAVAGHGDDLDARDDDADATAAAQKRKDEVWETVDTALNETIRGLRAGAFARLFGWTGGVGDDIHEDAAVHRIDPTAMYNYEVRRELDLSDASSWRNLLTVDSNFDIKLLIGDAGSTAVLIHQEDLDSGDLSGCYVTNESS